MLLPIIQQVFEFTDSELNELQVRKVRGADNKTIYSVGSNKDGNFLKAIADNAASGLGKEVQKSTSTKHHLLTSPGKWREDLQRY